MNTVARPVFRIIFDDNLFLFLDRQCTGHIFRLIFRISSVEMIPVIEIIFRIYAEKIHQYKQHVLADLLG